MKPFMLPKFQYIDARRHVKVICRFDKQLGLNEFRMEGNAITILDCILRTIKHNHDADDVRSELNQLKVKLMDEAKRRYPHCKPDDDKSLNISVPYYRIDFDKVAIIAATKDILNATADACNLNHNTPWFMELISHVQEN